MALVPKVYFIFKMEIARFYFIFYLYSVDGSILQSRVLLCKNSWVPQYESGVSRPIKIEHGHQGDVPTNNQRVPPLFVTNYIFISSYTPYLHWQLLQFRWQKLSLLLILITTTSLQSFLFYTSKIKEKNIVIKINFLFQMSGSCQSRNVPTYLAAPEAAG